MNTQMTRANITQDTWNLYFEEADKIIRFFEIGKVNEVEKNRLIAELRARLGIPPMK